MLPAPDALLDGEVPVAHGELETAERRGLHLAGDLEVHVGAGGGRLVDDLAARLAHPHHQGLVAVLALELVLEVLPDQLVVRILAGELEAQDPPRLPLASRPWHRVLARPVREGADGRQHLGRDLDLPAAAHAERPYDHARGRGLEAQRLEDPRPDPLLPQGGADHRWVSSFSM